MGHRLLKWSYSAHINLQLVFSDLTIYPTFTFTFIMFLTCIAEPIPYLWISWIMMGVFGLSIYVTTNQSPIISRNNRRRCPHPNWKRLNIWSCCKFHYWLIRRFRRQPRHRPPRLDDYFFPSPHCNKHQSWYIGKARAKVLFKRLRIDEFFSGRKDGYLPW